MKKSGILTLLVLAVGIQLFAQEDINKTFNGITRVKISTASANCVLKKSPSKIVKVNLKHSYNESSYQPLIEQQGARLVVKEIFNGNNNSTYNGSSTWTIEIPDSLDVTFFTGSGNLVASDLIFDGKLMTGSGNLIFNKVKGEITGTTGSGNISIENFEGEIQASTGNGDIQLAASKGDISVTCGSGNIKLSNSNAIFSATTGSGEITGQNIALDGSSKFTAGSGYAKITLATTPKFDLSVSSGSGDAIVDFNGNIIAGQIVMKANKKNGNIHAPFDFEKTEEINREDNVIIQKSATKGNASNRITISTGSGNAVLKK